MQKIDALAYYGMFLLAQTKKIYSQKSLLTLHINSSYLDQQHYCFCEIT